MNDIWIQIVCVRWTLLNVVPERGLAAGSCHIHPLGTDMKDAELRVTDWYDSLEECEIANKRFYGGSGSVIVFRTEFSIEQAMTGGLG